MAPRKEQISSGFPLTPVARIKPEGYPVEGHRRMPLRTHILNHGSDHDAHRPDPPLDRYQAARDQRDYRRDRALGRMPKPLDGSAYRLHPAHLGLAVDPGERLARRPPRSRRLPA